MANAIGIVSIALALCIVMRVTSATEYVVGDSAGWGLGTDYTSWAADKNFAVGDSLVFNYDSSHSVAEVKSNDYSDCSTANALSNENSSPTTMKLKTAGAHYFVCGVSSHCSNGMKLAVNVKADATTPTTASPVPSSSGSTSDGTTTTTPTQTPTTATTTTTSSNSSPLTTLPSFVAMLVGMFGFYVLLLVV